MKVNVKTGFIEGATLHISPNCDDRPMGSRADTIIIHAISLPPGEFGGPYIKQLFQNCLNPDDHSYFQEISDLKVSAHLLIQRNGELIQFVPLHKRAWHAGESVCEGRTQVNDFSIGIELEGSDDKPFEEIQYKQLALVINEIFKAYPDVTKNRIHGHCHIAPNRKTDPGPQFDWDRFRSELA